MKILKLFKRYRDNITLCFITLDKDKFREKKQGSCLIQTHPYLKDKLTNKEWMLIQGHLGAVTDIIRDKIDNVDEL